MEKTFKSKFLRRLYGELVLTQSFQKFTFFHLMFGVGPAFGFGIGLGPAETTASWLYAFGGAIVGGVLAWFLPQVLWKILYGLSRIDSLTEKVEDGLP
jgi:membrane associated rhomboid family serine protease